MDAIRSSLSLKLAELKETYRSISIPTYILVCVFGIGSWVAINGTWAELPVLAITQPECYRLGTVLSVIVQVANIGPLFYALIKILWHYCKLKLIYLEITSIFIIIIIGIVSCFLLSFFWSKTEKINNDSHSVVLIVLVFFLALVDCTSSVVFVPFMKHLPAIYLSSLGTGEGFSGVLPSVLALIQGSVNSSIHCREGVGTEYDVTQLGIGYNPDIYFLLLGVLVFVCGVAFLGILVLPAARKERVRQQLIVNTRRKSTSVNGVRAGSVYNSTSLMDDSDPLVKDDQEIEKEKRKIEKFQPVEVCNRSTSTLRQIIWRQRTPLVCVFLLSFMVNGTLNSISLYAFGHYSNLVLHLAVNFGILAQPIGALMYAFIPNKTKLLVSTFTSGILLMSIYITVVSMLGSSPPLLNHGGGIIIVSY